MERKTTKESQGSRKERKQMQKPDKEKAVAEEEGYRRQMDSLFLI